MQNIVDKTLASRWRCAVARILLAVLFLSSAAAKRLDFQAGPAEMRAAGLEPDWLFNTATLIAVLLGGPALLQLGRALRLGVGALAVFLLLTILVVHRFRTLPVPRGKAAIASSLRFRLEGQA